MVNGVSIGQVRKDRLLGDLSRHVRQALPVAEPPAARTDRKRSGSGRRKEAPAVRSAGAALLRSGSSPSGATADKPFRPSLSSSFCRR